VTYPGGYSTPPDTRVGTVHLLIPGWYMPASATRVLYALFCYPGGYVHRSQVPGWVCAPFSGTRVVYAAFVLPGWYMPLSCSPGGYNEPGLPPWVGIMSLVYFSGCISSSPPARLPTGL